MIDRFIYDACAPFYRKIAGPFIASGVTANQITLAGFVIGISAVPLLAGNHYGLALLAILLNRFLDGSTAPLLGRRLRRIAVPFSISPSISSFTALFPWASPSPIPTAMRWPPLFCFSRSSAPARVFSLLP